MSEGLSAGYLGLAADSETPIEHLDYNYIGKCNNTKEIEKLLRILRSGKEGVYPELVEFTEKRLEELNPRSKSLRKEIPVRTYHDLEKPDREKIKSDLKGWTVEMSKKEVQLQSRESEDAAGFHQESKNPLPPIRSAGNLGNATVQDGQVWKEDVKKNKNVVPREYREWDKFDPDKELEDQEEQEENARKKNQRQVKQKINIPTDINSTGITEQERAFRAVREKDKGNDAFRIGDYKESLVYYTRSLTLQPTAAAFNNRAAAGGSTETTEPPLDPPQEIKLKIYQDAIKDCDNVLELEPNNLKAFLRRGIAYKESEQLDKSRADIQQVLNIEPSNKRAKEILVELKKIQEKQDGSTNGASGTVKPKKKGQRLKIVEVDGKSDEEPDQAVGINSLSDGQFVETDTIGDVHNLDKNGSSKETTGVHAQNNTSDKPHREIASVSSGSLFTEPKNDISCSEPLRTNVKTVAESSSNENIAIHLKHNKGAEGLQKSNDTVSDPQPVQPLDSKPTNRTPELPLPGLAVKAKDAGTSLFKMGRYAEALEKYSAAIDILWKDKDNYQMSLGVLLSNRAACHNKIGDCDGCIEDCNKALTLVPSLTKPRSRRAAALETKERYIDAYTDYQAVLMADPFNKPALDGSSRTMRHLRSIHGPSWRDKVSLVPSQVTPLAPSLNVPAFASKEEISLPVKLNSSLGERSLPDGKADSPTESPDDALPKATPVTALTAEERFGQLKDKGNSYVKQGKYSEAVDCYTQCIEVCPEEVVSYTNRALCFLKLNKHNLAESDCSEALKLQANNVKALFRRALARKALKQYDEAAKDLFQLMKTEPKNTAGKKELDVVLELCREFSGIEVSSGRIFTNMRSKKKRRTAQQQETEAKSKEKTKHRVSESKSPAAGKSKKQPETANRKRDEPVRRKRIQIQEVEADEEDIDEENAASSSARQQPVGNGPTQSTASISTVSPKVNTGSSSVKQTKPETTQSKKSSTQKQAQEKVPSMKKATAYEFLQAWNSVKKDNIAGYAVVLSQVQPNSLPKVLSNKLDADMLKSIVSALARYLLPEGKPDLCYRILKNLCHAQRFDMVLLFLSESDKGELNSLFSKLETSQSKKAFVDVKDLRNLRKKYAL